MPIAIPLLSMSNVYCTMLRRRHVYEEIFASKTMSHNITQTAHSAVEYCHNDGMILATQSPQQLAESKDIV